MPFSFPSSPTVGQQSTQNGRVYAWTGSAWEIVSELASHVHSGADITTGTVATARLGSGTANSTTFLRGDGTWAAAGSSSASDLTTGTLANARLTTRQRASTNLYLWSSFR